MDTDRTEDRRGIMNGRGVNLGTASHVVMAGSLLLGLIFGWGWI
jgi:hypothetical protein